MGYLDDVLQSGSGQDLLAQQRPETLNALADALGIPEELQQQYRPFQPTLPPVPGKAPQPRPGVDWNDIFAFDAPPAAQNPQASRYQPRLGQFTNQAQYRMPMQGLGSIMMRRR